MGRIFKVVVQQWQESWEDYSSNFDGVSLHLTEADAAKYTKDLMKALDKFFIENTSLGKNLSYTRPTDLEPHWIYVSQFLFDRVKKAGGGLRLMPYQIKGLEESGDYLKPL